MPCYHPITCVRPDGSEVERGNKKLGFFSRSKYPDAFDFKTGHLLPLEELKIKFPAAELVQVPCRKCLGCRLDHAKEWSVRNVLESLSYDNNFFITLTYDDDHVFSERDGKIVPTLVKDDVKRFMKNLRRYFEYNFSHTGIRYFGCGEYGSTTNRPHYHLLVYNCPIPDLDYYKDKNGNTLFNSKIIDQCWNKGYSVIANFSYETAAYVSRYVLKKVDSNVDYNSIGLENEFIMMSTKPGIGRKYYDDHKDLIYKTDELFICDSSGHPISCKPVEYYDSLFESECPAEYKTIKDERYDLCKLSQESELLYTDLSRDQYLAVKENNMFAKLRSLQRA